MRIKLKNLIIFLSILGILVITGGLKINKNALAVDGSDLEALKARLNYLNTEKNRCLRLSGNAKISCLNSIMGQIEEVLNELKRHENLVNQNLSRINQDIQNLQNQINYIDAQTEKTEIEIRVLEQQINLTNLEISRTEEEIKLIERKMENHKQRLIASIKSYYEYDKKDTAIISILEGNLSNFFDRLVYLDNIQKQISQNLAQLKIEKKNVENKKITLVEKKKELELTIDSYNRQIVEMESLRQQKADLLEITKGDEAEYQRMMARVREAKSLAVANLRNVEELYLQLIPHSSPSSCLGFPYYSQKGGWGAMNCGDLISETGCAVTSTAMVFNYYGKRVTPTEIGICCTSGDNCFISWDKAGKDYGFNVEIGRRELLGKRYPAIAHTNLYGGQYGHYVVIIKRVNNGYLIADPWSGGCWVLKDGQASIDQVVIYTPK